MNRTCVFCNTLFASTIKLKRHYEDFHKSENPRNRREQRRVQKIKEEYKRLAENVPFVDEIKNPSKLEILKSTIKYIQQLENMLEETDLLPQLPPDGVSLSGQLSP